MIFESLTRRSDAAVSRRRFRLTFTVLFVFGLLVTAGLAVRVTRGQDERPRPPRISFPISDYMTPEGLLNVPAPASSTPDEFPSERQSDKKAPKLQQLRPKKVAIGGPEFRLRVNGENFKKDSTVFINGIAVPTVFNNTRNLFATIATSFTNQLGMVAVTVINPDGQATKAEPLEIVPALDSVVITNLQPRIVLEGGVSFALRIAGDGFRDDPEVRVGGETVEQKINRKGDDGLILAIVADRELSNAGTVPIQIVTNKGFSRVFNLIVAQSPPRIEKTEPVKLDLNGKDAIVRIRGRNYTPQTRVLINESEVPSTFINDGRIDAVVSAALLTKVQQLQFQVEIPDQGISDIVLVAVAGEAPVIYGLAPSRTVTGEQEFNVTINGANLSKEKKKTKVFIDGKSVNFEETSGKELVAKVRREKVDSPGTVKVSVTVGDVPSNESEIIVEQAGTVSTLAGDTPGLRDGVGTKAWFTRPSRAALGPDGGVYIADQLNNAVRRFDPSTGMVTTIAGDGNPGYVDTNDIDTTDKDKDNDVVRFNNPLGVAVDRNGTIYVTDFGNDVIRRIQRLGDKVLVDTYAGANRKRKDEDTGFSQRIGLAGYEDNVAGEARFSGPDGIVIAPDGRLFVADAFNNLIRVVTPAGTAPVMVSSLFGNQFPGIVDGTGPSVRLSTPTGLTLAGNTLYIADFGNNRVRALDLSEPNMRTVTGVAGPGNADGPRFLARLNGPLGIAFDGGKIFVLDNSSNRIRRVEPDGEISTAAGSSADFNDGIGPKARFRTPRDLGTWQSGQIYVVDQGNHRLRRFQGPTE